METTRHFTATIYVVNAGATVLHRHPRLDMWLPPGGHVDRDELPHRTALREAVEETGLEVDLVQDTNGPTSETARAIPRPARVMLEDINVHEGAVGHQHIDLIYHGTTADRAVSPLGRDEAPADAWEWFTAEQLENETRIDPDVAVLGTEAIEAAAASG